MLSLSIGAQQLWSTDEGRALTKVQPKRSITKDLRAEAVRLGNLNAFLTGVLGSGLLVVHILVYPWARVRLGVVSFPEFVKDALISYIWIDFFCLLVASFASHTFSVLSTQITPQVQRTHRPCCLCS